MKSSDYLYVIIGMLIGGIILKTPIVFYSILVLLIGLGFSKYVKNNYQECIMKGFKKYLKDEIEASKEIAQYLIDKWFR